MPGPSESPILWVFYLQLLLFLGPGVVALIDVWQHSKHESRASRMRSFVDENVHPISPPRAERYPEIEESEEEERRAS